MKIQNESFRDYTGDFETTGSLLMAETEQNSNIRFRNVKDFESYIIAIDVDDDRRYFFLPEGFKN